MADIPDRSARSLRRATALLPVCFAAVIFLSAVAVRQLAHDPDLGRWMDEQWSAFNETPNFYALQYLDFEDRLVLDELPALDCSKGGVYLFGSSNTKWATELWELPAEQKRLIHNFGAGEGLPLYEHQFIRYLVEHKDLLHAGGENTMVILGDSFVNVRTPADSGREVWPTLWRRYGLYTYQLSDGVQPVPTPAVLKGYQLEKARCCSFVQAVLDRSKRALVPAGLRRRRLSKDPTEYAKMYAERMGPNWRETMAEHVADMGRLLDYLADQKIRVRMVHLPLASWHQSLPYPAEYRRQIEDLCRRKSVVVVDFSDLLSDDEFFDHIHANEAGRKKLSQALVNLGLEHLRERGILQK